MPWSRGWWMLVASSGRKCTTVFRKPPMALMALRAELWAEKLSMRSMTRCPLIRRSNHCSHASMMLPVIQADPLWCHWKSMAPVLTPAAWKAKGRAAVPMRWTGSSSVPDILQHNATVRRAFTFIVPEICPCERPLSSVIFQFKALSF